MTNPWEKISLSDYENHMNLDSVMQLQTMNRMMKGQLDAYSVKSVMILGIAGGNGLEHINKNKLELTKKKEADKLPRAELLIANLLIEYVGYACFQDAVEQAQPQYVSCIIQIDADDSWVSDSPYLHAFGGLDKVHHQIEESRLIQAMNDIGYRLIAQAKTSLPNGKKLAQLDFVC